MTNEIKRLFRIMNNLSNPDT